MTTDSLDLSSLRFWIKKYPGGVRGFARDHKLKERAVHAVLSGEYVNMYLIDKMAEAALQISTRAVNRLAQLKDHYQQIKTV